MLKGLVELKKVGVFAHTLFKKQRYWPKYVPGDEIINCFADKEIGESDAIKGDLDGVPFHLYGMKEPNYTMQIMSTYGTLAAMGNEKRHVMVNGS